MTTAAMVLGVMPLVFARGAGGASRYAIGLVISSGLAIGTLFTLFVVPAVYLLIGATHRTQPARALDIIRPNLRRRHVLSALGSYYSTC